jgi:hypothetical protein
MDARRPNDLEWSESVEGRESSFVLTPSRMSSIPLLVFAGLWDSFFVMLWTGLTRVHAPERAFAFPIAHAVVGVIVTWMALVRCLNSSRITLGTGELVVRHSPIPARGARIATKTIDHFEVYDAPGKRGQARSVRAVTSDGGPVSLGLALDGLDEVAFVASRLNGALATARGGTAGSSGSSARKA